MVSDAREHIPEPGERLDSATLAHGDETHQHGRGLAAVVTAEKSPVAPADCDVAVGPFGAGRNIAIFDLSAADLLNRRLYKVDKVEFTFADWTGEDDDKLRQVGL